MAMAAGALLITGVAVPSIFGSAPAPSDLSLPGSAAPCNDQWAMYQHDPSHHGAPTCSGINPMSVAGLTPSWFYNTSQPVTAEPTVSDGQLYVGDAGGTFYDVNASSGTLAWKFQVEVPSYSCTVTVNGVSTTSSVLGDTHAPSYGEITSSANVTTLTNANGQANADPTVFFGAGGTLFALDATKGTCIWAQNLDPQNPGSGMEAESSPVVFQRNPGQAEVIVGSDGNESPGTTAPPGVQAFDAYTGKLLWKFEPENNQTDTTESAAAATDGCGDVWSSPALDPKWGPGNSAHGLVVITTGNCPPPPQGTIETPAVPVSPISCPYKPLDPPVIEGIAGIDATTGCLVWRWSEPDNQYASASFPDGGDTDFGASPILTTIAGTPPTPAVIDGGKSGYMYALNEGSGAQLWANQIAQPGETGPAFAGAIGGFIGSDALGSADGKPTVFGATAILAPFTGAGAPTPDPSLICVQASSVSTTNCDPLRIASLHAVNAATGNVEWQGLISLPTYAAVTYSNGVIFAPQTTGFSIVAYSAETGMPLWAFPLAAAPSSGTAIVGSSIFFGTGTGGLAGAIPVSGAGSLPPQESGIWSFSTSL